MIRRRLPNRRYAISETIEMAGHVITARVGFDPESDRPAELFMSGAKNGTDLGFVLDDASVVISIALQHGIRATDLAKSVARVPDHSSERTAASVIGKALDLIARLDAIPPAQPSASPVEPEERGVIQCDERRP